MQMTNMSDHVIKVPVELFTEDARPSEPVLVQPGGTVEIDDQHTIAPEYTPGREASIGVRGKSTVERLCPQLMCTTG